MRTYCSKMETGKIAIHVNFVRSESKLKLLKNVKHVLCSIRFHPNSSLQLRWMLIHCNVFQNICLLSRIQQTTNTVILFYLIINCFSGQFGEILTKVCKICTSAARAILSKLRSIFSQIWPEKRLISRLVPALWETLNLLNLYVNFVDLIAVMTSFAVTSTAK